MACGDGSGVSSAGDAGSFAHLPSSRDKALADFPGGAHDDQVDALARAFAALDAPSYDTSMRWVTGDDPAAADAMRRLEAQMNMMRFQQQHLWMFSR
jgi:glutathione S-transferase